MSEEMVARWAQDKGYAWAAGCLETLDFIRDALARRISAGELEAAFAAQWLNAFNYLEGCRLERPRSVLILALPCPAYVLTFHPGDRVRKMILPPTYARYRDTFAAVRKDLNRTIEPGSRHFEVLNAPLKSLAAVLGLVRYGRNNIAYAPGPGSYFQLVGLVSDLEFGGTVPGPAWEWPMLPECAGCDLCIKGCTRGAISPDRFLLYAERCVVPLTETPGVLEPGLVHPSPACIIGCLRCQLVCPVNKGKLRYEDSGVHFTPEETEAILHQALPADDPRWMPIRAKFDSLGMTEPAEIYARNARFLLNWGQPRPA